jgi:dephospho-CoA kinase
MLAVGLTGGIGSGKSTAAELFAKLGAAVTDTDVIARTLTAPGQPLLKVIANEFGMQFFTPDGTLDRAALRRLVFNDATKKRKLESILHPLIRQTVTAELAHPTTAPYRIVVVPLLFETRGYADLVQRTLVVDCPEELQIQRATARSALTEIEVRAMMAEQMPRELRLAHADDVIVNDASLENLAELVDEMHKKYIRLA